MRREREQQGPPFGAALCFSGRRANHLRAQRRLHGVLRLDLLDDDAAQAERICALIVLFAGKGDDTAVFDIGTALCAAGVQCEWLAEITVGV